MVRLPFSVNDESLRQDFLENMVFSALERLAPGQKPVWGRMTPQQMVEHLVWATEISNGAVTVGCNLHPKLVERFKSFLHNDMPTTHDFMNPLLKSGLPSGRFSDIKEAVANLRDLVHDFLGEEPVERRRQRTHPVFGPLDHDEWSRAHFKHFCHHLLQFGLIAIDQPEVHIDDESS
jgi:hypothetical protein